MHWTRAVIPPILMQCALQTAKLLFNDAAIMEETLLDEVVQRAYKETERKLSLWY